MSEEEKSKKLPKALKPSSTVQNLAYRKNAKELEVTYHKTGKYVYEGVPFGTYLALRRAPSLGKYIHMNIKGNYDYRKILDSVPESTKQEAAAKIAFLRTKIAIMQGLGQLAAGAALGGTVGGAVGPKGGRLASAALGSIIGAGVASKGTPMASTYKPVETPSPTPMQKRAWLLLNTLY